MPDLRERAAEVCGPYDVLAMRLITIKKTGSLGGTQFFGSVKF